MCRTPAPPSTAFVASSIWSGVGDVNTAPGHAASSIPRPTKPPRIGSRPGAPPPRAPTPPRARRAGARGVEHPAADEAAVHRLVAGAAARDDAHLALDRRVGADHVVGLVVDFDEVAVRGLHALKRVAYDIVRRVDQLLHRLH